MSTKLFAQIAALLVIVGIFVLYALGRPVPGEVWTLLLGVLIPSPVQSAGKGDSHAG